jgi:dephospho-CoA kinase
MKLIGITGTFGSGKGTVVDLLKKKLDFVYVNARELIIEVAKDEGVKIENRDDMREYVDGRNKRGRSLTDDINERYNTKENQNKIFVFESIRRVKEVEEFRAIFGKDFLFVSVDTPIQQRYERIVQRGSMTDQVSFEKFQEQEMLENVSDDPNKMNLYKCRDMADVKILNIGTLEDLEKEIDEKLLKSSFFSVL